MMANTFISKEQFCRDYHVGKATALWLIQTGLLSAIDTGRKTGRYLIADTDIQTFVYTSTYLRSLSISSLILSMSSSSNARLLSSCFN